MNRGKRLATLLKGFLLLLMLPPCLVACSHHYDKVKLAGRYVLNVGSGADVLELKNDGTYFHSFQSTGGSKTTANGKWELESLDAGPTVILDEFHRLPEEITGGSGYYLLPIENFFGKVCLMTNEDANECYEKE